MDGEALRRVYDEASSRGPDSRGYRSRCGSAVFVARGSAFLQLPGHVSLSLSNLTRRRSLPLWLLPEWVDEWSDTYEAMEGTSGKPLWYRGTEVLGVALGNKL